VNSDTEPSQTASSNSVAPRKLKAVARPSPTSEPSTPPAVFGSAPPVKCSVARPQLVASATVVLDCTDNFATRHAINHACVAARVPLVSGAAIRMDGQIAVFDPRSGESACYACLFPPDQQFEEVQCSTMGVFAPLVGIIGTMQAAEALKLVAGIGESLANRLLLLDARTMEWTSIRTAKNTDCVVCGGSHAG
jgi:molybdopterin/thiamine biosynthesis adenylyltransferase